MREKEAREAAGKLNAVFHESMFNDLEIFYNEKSVRMLSALIRDVKPDILLIPSPADYMEDHVNTARLGVTASFSRCMKNWQSLPLV